MRRSLLIPVAVLLAGTIVPAAGALGISDPLTPVHVAPGTGHPGTTFKLSLRSPDQTGASGDLRRQDTLSVAGPHRSGCVSSAHMTLPAARAHQLVSMSLKPSRLGGRWCQGTFKGEIDEAQRFVCDPPHLCPQLEIRPRTIARFTFRVTRTG
jgi:hypothetical protein